MGLKYKGIDCILETNSLLWRYGMNGTKIEWTDSTWNPATGCTKISTGCTHCYAEKMALRLQKMGVEKYRNGFDLTLHPQTLGEPDTWSKPKMVFVNSMSDLFHEDMPFSYIKKVFDVMNRNKRHTFQVLTKRAEVLHKLAPKLEWGENIWMGVTVEIQDKVDRIDALRETNAAIKFLSCEPLLSALPNINLSGINWVIVGGESGPKARPIDPAWVDDIHHQCRTANVPFFFKQWGGVNKKAAGRVLHGETYSEMPSV